MYLLFTVTVCIFKRAIIIKRCLPVLELDDGGGGGTRQHATCNLGSEFREHIGTKVLPVTRKRPTGTTTFAQRKHRYLVLAEV